MEPGPNPPPSRSSSHLWPTQRCRLCQFEEGEAIHRPVSGSGMFATFGPADGDSPWEPHWAEPHHVFIAPALPTFTYLARTIADHALDLEADERLSWETAGFDSLAEELSHAYPDGSGDVEAANSSSRRGVHRVATWLTAMMVFLSIGAAAFAAPTHHDIVEAEQRIVDLELERLSLLAEAFELESDLAREEGMTIREEQRSREAEYVVAKVEQKRVEVGATVYPSAVGGDGALAFSFGWGAVNRATLAAAYAEAAAENQDVVAQRHAARLAELRAAVGTGEEERALEAEVRDLRVRVGEIGNELVAAHEDLETVRGDVQRRLGISDRVEQWRPLVAKYFPADVVDDALVVMACESSGKADARAWPRSSAVGLFQFLHGVWEWTIPYAGIEEGTPRTDPDANVKAAAWLWDFAKRTRHPDGQWGLWSCKP